MATEMAKAVSKLLIWWFIYNLGVEWAKTRIKTWIGNTLTQSATLYLLLSASAGSIPGKLIVIADGAPTSYVLTGLWHTFRRIRVLNTTVDSVPTGALTLNSSRVVIQASSLELAQWQLAF